jgi:Tfp pilus assembly protein PilN
VLTPVGVAVALGALAWGYLIVRDIQDEARRLDSQYSGVMAEIAKQSSKNNALKDSISQEQAAVLEYPPQATQLENQIAQIKAQGDFFSSLVVDYSDALDKGNLNLREAVALVPEGINLESIENSGDAYRIKGRAGSETLILAYGRSLEASGRFGMVVVDAISAITYDDGSKALEFDIIMT